MTYLLQFYKTVANHPMAKTSGFGGGGGGGGQPSGGETTTTTKLVVTGGLRPAGMEKAQPVQSASQALRAQRMAGSAGGPQPHTPQPTSHITTGATHHGRPTSSTVTSAQQKLQEQRAAQEKKMAEEREREREIEAQREKLKRDNAPTAEPSATSGATTGGPKLSLVQQRLKAMEEENNKFKPRTPVKEEPASKPAEVKKETPKPEPAKVTPKPEPGPLDDCFT